MAVAGASRLWAIRTGLLALIAANVLMIAIRVASYPAVLHQPGGLRFVLEPLVMLVPYAVFALWATGDATPGRQMALSVGTLCGFISGLVSNLCRLRDSDCSATS